MPHSHPLQDTHLLDRLRRIRLLALDVDGVLTDGQLYFQADGIEIKAFNVQDGHGLKLLKRAGIHRAYLVQYVPHDEVVGRDAHYHDPLSSRMPLVF